jgi:hypothetical protein
MSLSRGMEVFFDSKMYLHRPALEPAATSRCQVIRLGNPRDANDAFVEVFSLLLLARGHG